MAFALLGINHKTAPLAEREQVAFHAETLESALYSLTSHPFISGAVILSTCNRTELYFSFSDFSSSDSSCSEPAETPKKLNDIQEIVKRWLYEYHHIQALNFESHLYFYDEKETMIHLMEVACGLDSMILGEPQILGQVRQAYQMAKQHHCLSSDLNALFQTAFHVAKKVRTQTEIGSHSASVAYSVYQLILRTFFTYSSEKKASPLRLMLVGAGEMNALIARYLAELPFQSILIANRSQEKAQEIADPLNAEVISLSAIADRLKEVDIVISCTASPLPIIGKGMIERSLIYRAKQQQKTPMLLIDLAVPHDIEREISALPNVILKTIDDLKNVIDSHLELRQKAALRAKTLIQEEAQAFLETLKERRAAQLIIHYRTLAQAEKKRLLQKMGRRHQQKGALIDNQQLELILKQFAYQLTQNLLHLPTQIIKKMAHQTQKNSLKLIQNELTRQDEKRSLRKKTNAFKSHFNVKNRTNK